MRYFIAAFTIVGLSIMIIAKNSSGKDHIDWSQQELKPRKITSTLFRASEDDLKVTYTVIMPRNMRINKRGSEKNMKQFNAGESGYEPVVFTEVLEQSPDGKPPKTINEAMKFLRPMGRKIIKKMKVKEVILISTQSDEEIQIDSWLPFEEYALHCIARKIIHKTDEGKVDSLLAWLERICISLTLVK